MKRLIHFLLIFLTFLSCKKQGDEESSCSSNDWQFVYIASPLKSLFFKNGSYWIFKNDSTNSQDSLVVTQYETGCEAVYLYQGTGGNWEYYKISYKSYPSGYQYYDMIELDMMQRNRHPSEYPSIQGWILFSTIDTTLYPWHPVHIDSLKVKDQTFYQLQLSKHINYNNYFPTDSDFIYTAPNYGIVRRVNMDSTGKHVWNLIRWKIIK